MYWSQIQELSFSYFDQNDIESSNQTNNTRWIATQIRQINLCLEKSNISQCNRQRCCMMISSQLTMQSRFTASGCSMIHPVIMDEYRRLKYLKCCSHTHRTSYICTSIYHICSYHQQCSRSFSSLGVFCILYIILIEVRMSMGCRMMCQKIFNNREMLFAKSTKIHTCTIPKCRWNTR